MKSFLVRKPKRVDAKGDEQMKLRTRAVLENGDMGVRSRVIKARTRFLRRGIGRGRLPTLEVSF